MEIVLGMYRLRDPGGTEHYTLTAAEQLQRLGHTVTIFTEETRRDGRARAQPRTAAHDQRG